MASLAISVFALAVSIVALVWQFISWVRNGPVVRVRAHGAIPVFQGVLSDRQYLAVTAINRGRASATITGWGLLFPGGARTATESAPLPGVQPLPYRIEPYTEASWYIEVAELGRICRERGIAQAGIRPFVEVSGQKRKLGKSLGSGWLRR